MGSGSVPMLELLEREMSITPSEFVRSLNDAFPGAVAQSPQALHVSFSMAAMEIELQPGPPRTIALLSLPTIRVRIRFTAGDAGQRAAMLERMDRYMQRGGG